MSVAQNNVPREKEREITLALLQLLSDDGGLDTLLPNITDVMRRWSGCQAVGIRLKQGILRRIRFVGKEPLRSTARRHPYLR